MVLAQLPGLPFGIGFGRLATGGGGGAAGAGGAAVGTIGAAGGGVSTVLTVGGGVLLGELRQDSRAAIIQADLTSVELVQGQHIVNSGRTRQTLAGDEAVVWVASEIGKA